MVCATSAGSCRSASIETPPIVQPGAPGQASRVITADKASDLSTVTPTAADVSFMQRMIGHHAQAVEMVALIESRTARDDMRLLGRRIEVSQSDEIAMMRQWLGSQGHALRGLHAHHGEETVPMAGMLTPRELASLADARGNRFDRLFLEGMIRHHGGALVMVQELQSSPGAMQEAEIADFASHVDSDQRMEILRMNSMLKGLKK